MFETHLKEGSKIPGVITYENNIKFMSDLPFAAYFETTPGSSWKIYMDEPKMYPILYCLIFAFHPKVNLEKTVIMRNYSHYLEQLTDISYLNKEMLENLDLITAKQLKDYTIPVFNKKSKFALS